MISESSHNEGTDLHALIRTMDRNEKGYFKKYARVHLGEEGTSYLELFDVIAAQQEYDEARLRKKLKGRKFLNQLPVAKHYLYEQVLRCLRNFQTRSNPKLTMSAIADNAEILITRGLHHQAGRQSRKLLQVATELDNPVRQIMAYDNFRRLASYLPAQARREQVRIALEETENIASRILREQPMFRYYFQVYDLVQASGRQDRESDLEAAEKTLVAPYREDELDELGFRSRMLFHTTQTFHAFLVKDMQKAEHHSLRLVEIYEAHPVFQETAVAEYIGAVSNYFVCKPAKPLRDDFFEFEQKILALTAKYPAGRPAAHQFFSQHAIQNLLAARRYDDIPAFADRLEAGMQQFPQMLNPGQEMVLIYQTGLGLWFAGDTARALHFINKVIDDYDASLRRDSQARARILLLLLHLERGNAELLESLVRSARHFLRTRAYYTEREKIFLRHISKVKDAANAKEAQSVYRKLAQALTDPALPASTPATLELYIEQWVQSKLEGVSFREVLLR